MIFMDYQRLKEFFRQLDRAYFIDHSSRSLAGIDSALPIGFGQTISQPSLVLQMTSLLEPEPDSRVLEIGTGSGYQTALLAEFAAKVFTIERVPQLAEKAEQRLDNLGYTNISYKCGDGSCGWPEEAPFDRIMVTAAAGKIPDELVRQLGRGGRMIIPVGPQGLQELLLITREQNGRIKSRPIEHVVFVEFKGKYGWNRED